MCTAGGGRLTLVCANTVVYESKLRLRVIFSVDVCSNNNVMGHFKVFGAQKLWLPIWTVAEKTKTKHKNPVVRTLHIPSHLQHHAAIKDDDQPFWSQ
jgi:hypothetical protein